MRIQIKKITGGERAKAIYGGFNLRIKLPEERLIEIGRGSLPVIQRLRLFPRQLSQKPLIGKIGQFVEVADARIILGGEHPRSAFGNTVFAGLVEMLVTSNDIPMIFPYSNGPVIIGNSVTISEGAIVLSGARLADDVILAAGTVCPSGEYIAGVWGGVPAKLLRPQLHKIFEFWKYRTKTLVEEKEKFLNGEMIRAADRFDEELFLELTPIMDGGSIKSFFLSGVERLGERKKFENLPEYVKNYFSQVSSEGMLEIDLNMDLILGELFR